jgi:hypothetical protein
MFHTDLHLVFLRFLLEQRGSVRPVDVPYHRRRLDPCDHRRPNDMRPRRLRRGHARSGVA